MSLMITASTRFAIYLAVTFNGKPSEAWVTIDLETGEGEFLERNAARFEWERVKRRGEFKLGLVPRLPSTASLSPEFIIEEMRQSVLFDAMSMAEKAQCLAGEPLPRDAELKQIFDRLFADYRASLVTATPE